MKLFVWILWRGSLFVFFAVLSIMALCLLIVVGAYLQVTGHFKGTAILPADCAVVFGAAVYGNLPGPAIVRRVSTAAEFYREGTINRLILSGGRGEGNRQSEAQVMKKEALRHGVKSADIVLEDKSHSTWENILYAKNLTSDCSSVVGISDGYHLARIELIARRQGWDLQTAPAGNRPPEESEHKSVYREMFAYLYYLLRMDYWISTQALQEQFSDRPEQGFVGKDLLQRVL